MTQGELESLDVPALLEEAARFAEAESAHSEPALFGVTDGKAVGTYIEQKFVRYLGQSYRFGPGNAASGVDLPGLGVDIKATSDRQPQGSSPFRSARQKIYGLGYDLLIFVYQKSDDPIASSSCLSIRHTIFVSRERTADYQLTRTILEALGRDANADDLVALMEERNLPLDYDIQAYSLAEEIIAQPPLQGYLTISNALQWRLQYRRAISCAGTIDGLIRVR